MSLFDAFSEELKVINDMSTAMHRPPLFVNDFAERPRGFGFLIRPTMREFNDFVRLLDKMMSENISRDFFLHDVPFDVEEERRDGKILVHQKGTIQILEDWLSRKFHTSEPEVLKDALATFRKVRQLRQKPAHAVDEDTFDRSLFQRQRQLMIDAYSAVRTLRLRFANHPLVKDVKVSEALREGKIWNY